MKRHMGYTSGHGASELPILVVPQLNVIIITLKCSSIMRDARMRAVNRLRVSRPMHASLVGTRGHGSTDVGASNNLAGSIPT